MLTGPPRLGGEAADYVSADGPMECEWDNSESRLRRYASGTVEVLQRRERLRGRFTIDGWSETDAEALLMVLRDPFEVCPRTWQAGDPGDAGDEVEVMCRLTNGRAATSPIYRTDNASGRPVWRFDVEFESLTLDEDPYTLGGSGCVFADEPEGLTLTIDGTDLVASFNAVTTPVDDVVLYLVWWGTATGIYPNVKPVVVADLGDPDESPIEVTLTGSADVEQDYYAVVTALRPGT